MFLPSFLLKQAFSNKNPKIETIEKIAAALEVDPFSLYSFDMATTVLNKSDINDYFIYHLEQLGYFFGCDSEGNVWIEYPDGTNIDYNEFDLDSLRNETDSYIKFKLEELRKKKLK